MELYYHLAGVVRQGKARIPNPTIGKSFFMLAQEKETLKVLQKWLATPTVTGH
jgi:hypothetical protein